MKERTKTQSNFIIYKAENVLNGEVYIGATTGSIHKRKLDHLQRAKREENNKFHVAISTYGAWAFSWEQIDTANSVNELARKEKDYIIAYNSKEEGYNSDSGGGFKKKVYQYDIKTGKLINTFESLKSAGNAVNANKRQISKACISVNQTFGGYRWSYQYKKKFIPNKDKRLKEIKQLTLNGKWVETFTSIREASFSTGINHNCIAKVCRGERKSAGGFVWKYV